MDPSTQPPALTPPLTQPSHYPPKRKLSAGAIVGIIFGAIALLATILAIILIITRDDTSPTPHDTDTRISEFGPPDQDSKQNPANLSPTATYQNERISFKYPTFTEQRDTSNVTIIMPDGSSPNDAQVFATEGSTSKALIDYQG